jgi:hypothetical protein
MGKCASLAVRRPVVPGCSENSHTLERGVWKACFA